MHEMDIFNHLIARIILVFRC